MGLVEEWGLLKPGAPRLVVLLSSDLAGPCCLPCSLVTSLPSLSQGTEKASLYWRGLAKSWEMVFL